MSPCVTEVNGNEIGVVPVFGVSFIANYRWGMLRGDWTGTKKSLNPCRGVAQMVERSLSMREVPGSIPGASKTFYYLLTKLNVVRQKWKENSLHRPGIEPGPPAWQASILPLNQRCWHTLQSRQQSDGKNFVTWWAPTVWDRNKNLLSQSVGFEPTLPEGNWFRVSRLNHSATTAHGNRASLVQW